MFAYLVQEDVQTTDLMIYRNSLKIVYRSKIHFKIDAKKKITRLISDPMNGAARFSCGFFPLRTMSRKFVQMASEGAKNIRRFFKNSHPRHCESFPVCLATELFVQLWQLNG